MKMPFGEGQGRPLDASSKRWALAFVSRFYGLSLEKTLFSWPLCSKKGCAEAGAA